MQLLLCRFLLPGFLQTAQEYLRPTNRTILILEAGAGETTEEVASND